MHTLTTMFYGEEEEGVKIQALHRYILIFCSCVVRLARDKWRV